MRNQTGADAGAESLATTNTRGDHGRKELRVDGHLDEAVRKTIIRVVDQTFTHPPAHHGEVGNALGVRRKNHLWRMRSQKGFQLPNETRRYLAARPL